MSTIVESDLHRYELVDRYAVGGAAEIYRARDTKSGRLVVIKRMRPDLEFDPAISAGFLREIHVAMSARHKNLIRGLARGSHEGLDWVALEYIEGQDLARLLWRERERKRPLPLDLSLFIAREILDGLALAHNLLDPLGQPMGLVHRDLSPRNVLLGYDGSVKVADFGASFASLTEPPPSEVVGSPGYLSPEQARLEPLDARSDVFAMGCLLYELVTKEPAFDIAGKKAAQVLKLHKKGQIRDVPEAVPEPIRLIIEIACSPDREDRYASASAMRDAIDEVRRDFTLAQLKGALGSMMRALFYAEMQAERARST